MKKQLVVFYSRTGATRRLAHRLAERLDADVEEIFELHPRRGILRCVFDALSGHEPDIAAPLFKASDYERVIVGSPVWAGRVASPVRSYLVAYSETFREVSFFCTCYRHGFSAFADMASLCDRLPRATLMVLASATDVGASVALDGFVRQLASARR
ncbi:flavodoxin family protein [Solimonas marina]|uniref:Flavodoxin n=1 Tax=Solimonas marina TaxID=2714601 RepID=A0A969WCI9_9GAMM|nr:flavodoxin [Solimonas marina]NKF23590.1 flavodoxin [Solimonas marina]